MNRAAPLLLLALAGCMPQGFVAAPSEYAAYRATRVGATFADRLGAANRYLLDFPDGWYKDEVRAFFDPAEEAFFALKKDSKAGLLAYLDALPRGPHREEARRRIDELEHAERSAKGEIERSAAAVEARVSGRAAAERREVQATVEAWIARLVDRGLYEAPIEAASAETLVPFALSLPSPRCTHHDPPDGGIARRCSKLLGLGYTIEVGRGTEQREATVEITIAEDPRGVPLEAAIGGPDLFSRLEETHRVKPVAPDDTALRAQAVTRAVELVRGVFAHVISDAPACRKRPAAPAVMELACAGMRVIAIPAARAGEDDRIEIRPGPG